MTQVPIARKPRASLLEMRLVETRPVTCPVEPQAFSIAEFCARNRISLSTFHKLKNQGRGPRLMCLGRAIRISVEAERDWRALREKASGAERRAIMRDAQRRSAAARQAGTSAAKSPRHVSRRRPAEGH
jgi:hypothetical protein